MNSITKTRKETCQKNYNKEQTEEYLLDAIMNFNEPESSDIPEIIFVNDEPLIIQKDKIRGEKKWMNGKPYSQ